MDHLTGPGKEKDFHQRIPSASPLFHQLELPTVKSVQLWVFISAAPITSVQTVKGIEMPSLTAWFYPGGTVDQVPVNLIVSPRQITISQEWCGLLRALWLVHFTAFIIHSSTHLVVLSPSHDMGNMRSRNCRWEAGFARTVRQEFQ